VRTPCCTAVAAPQDRQRANEVEEAESLLTSTPVAGGEERVGFRGMRNDRSNPRGHGGDLDPGRSSVRTSINFPTLPKVERPDRRGVHGLGAKPIHCKRRYARLSGLGQERPRGSKIETTERLGVVVKAHAGKERRSVERGGERGYVPRRSVRRPDVLARENEVGRQKSAAEQREDPGHPRRTTFVESSPLESTASTYNSGSSWL
jgi:hypothetical protein